ncbi:sigma-70 family RNA polymerase sigma factor [Oscillospiraceae bacterium 21-37]|uniref:sigma-70 family RNA polymerase sigma factor n=1 Tax=Lawsonibacter sp. JLR.KK007 TaxID=3114293 RepID=UPI001363AF2B|nr:sigma-70 family RNA polymerase sigma factor [Clostridiaceae bacterium]
MEHLTSTQQKMVEENHNLIYGMAHKYKINLDEYYDVLAIGLCKAAMTFDETKGQFSTFAYVTMLNEYNAVLRHNKTYMVIPEQNLVSMNTQMISDDGNGVVEYGDLFPADVDIEKDTVETDYVSFLCNQINHPQEQEVIKLLANGFTQAEIAEKMGVSRQRIGQLMNKIRERLRKYAA